MWELGVGVLISGLIYFGSDKLPKQILYREKREELIKQLTTNASDRTQILTKYKDMFTDEAIENDYDSTKIDELFIKSLYLLDNDLDNYFKQTMSEIDVIIQASV